MNSSEKKNFFKNNKSNIVPHHSHTLNQYQNTPHLFDNDINNNNNDFNFDTNNNSLNNETSSSHYQQEPTHNSKISKLLNQFNNVTNTLNNSNNNNKLNKKSQEKYDLIFNNQNHSININNNQFTMKQQQQQFKEKIKQQKHHNDQNLIQQEECEKENQRISKETKKNVNYLVSGSIAGAISRSATAGFERLTIIQQVQGMSQNLSKNYVGCIGALKEMVQREGFKSLFKGNGANIVKVSPNSGIRFLTYEFCKKNFLKNESDKMTVPQTMFSGAMAGLTSTFFTYPLDVVRIRLSLQGSCQNEYGIHRYNGITHGFVKITQEEGMKGLYKGLGTSIFSIVPWVSISFATYEGFKIVAKKTLLPKLYNDINNDEEKEKEEFEKLIKNKEILFLINNNNNNNNNNNKNNGNNETKQSQKLFNFEEAKKGVNMICDFLCGALSGAVTMTVCYPLDVLRRRMMIQGIGGNKVLYSNGFDAAKKIFSSEGIKAFYHGIIPAYFKVVPTVAISFAVYELCKELFGENIPSSSSSSSSTNTTNINNDINNNLNNNNIKK